MKPTTPAFTRLPLALLLGLAVTFPSALAAAAPEDGFVAMFHGSDLTGWDGSPGWWHVENGAIVAESTPEKPSDRTHYLYWQGGEPSDFEMRCRYRVTGAGGNSGIQFRSQSRPNWDTWGYQADLDTAGDYTGCLYQHERGLVAERGQKVVIDPAGQKTITRFADSAALLAVVKDNDWNEYRILARGPHIALWINGILMCEVEDHEKAFALPKGIIALQMHAGPPMRIAFKDLRIRIMKPTQAGSALRSGT
jgi:hypothetical protein